MMIKRPTASPLKQLGISLVEVAVAALILMISLAGVMKFESNLIGSLSVGRQQSTATHLAESLIDEFRSYTVIATTNGAFAYDDIVTGNRTETKSNVTYTLAWTVTDYSDPDYKEVDLNISWNDRGNTTHTVAFSTNIAKVDPTQAYTGNGNGNNGNGNGNGNNGNGNGNGGSGGVLL